MIRQILFATLAASAILASTSVLAQNIAVVNIQSAILSSAYGQQELEKFGTDPEFADLVAAARSLQADMDSLDSQARAEASGWSDEDFAQYTRTKQFLEADLSLATQKINSEQDRVANEIIAFMNDAAIQALEEIIEEQNISLLLNDTAVLHADQTHNLSAVLAERLSQ